MTTLYQVSLQRKIIDLQSKIKLICSKYLVLRNKLTQKDQQIDILMRNNEKLAKKVYEAQQEVRLAKEKRMELNDEGQIKEPVTRVVVTKNSIKGNCNGEDHPKEASNALLKWDILRKQWINSQSNELNTSHNVQLAQPDCQSTVPNSRNARHSNPTRPTSHPSNKTLFKDDLQPPSISLQPNSIQKTLQNLRLRINEHQRQLLLNKDSINFYPSQQNSRIRPQPITNQPLSNINLIMSIRQQRDRQLRIIDEMCEDLDQKLALRVPESNMIL